MANAPKTCFVMMPISDSEGYGDGHFRRVYQHLIKPACLEAGYEPIRADDVLKTNYIIIDVIRRILDCDMVVCDLSSRNPNVLYELGLRQAFNRKAVLLKDKCSDRIFDIQGLRTVDYDESLRVDTVKRDTETIKQALTETMESAEGDVNSLIQMLGIPKAELPSATELSPDTPLILEHIRDLSQRLTSIEDNLPKGQNTEKSVPRSIRQSILLPNGHWASVGSEVYIDGETVGELVEVSNQGIVVRFNGDVLSIPPDDPRFENVSTVPF